MTERTDADRRAILREHGHEVTSRGKLSPQMRALADDIASGAEPGSEETEFMDGISADDFGPEPGEENGAGPGAEPPATPLPPERKPRRVRPPKATLRERLTGGGAKPGAKRKARHARVPVDRFIGRVWETLARVAAPVSPAMSRTLQIQGPVAGLILEDAVRNTVVDRVLQPAVRVEERAEKVIALAAPPLLVAAIEQAQGLPEPQRQMRLALLLPMLEEALSLWVKIAGDKVEEAAARHAASEATREQVTALIAAIFPQAEMMPEEPQMAGAM